MLLPTLARPCMGCALEREREQYSHGYMLRRPITCTHHSATTSCTYITFIYCPLLPFTLIPQFDTPIDRRVVNLLLEALRMLLPQGLKVHTRSPELSAISTTSLHIPGRTRIQGPVQFLPSALHHPPLLGISTHSGFLTATLFAAGESWNSVRSSAACSNTCMCAALRASHTSLRLW